MGGTGNRAGRYRNPRWASLNPTAQLFICRARHALLTPRHGTPHNMLCAMLGGLDATFPTMRFSKRSCRNMLTTGRRMLLVKAWISDCYLDKLGAAPRDRRARTAVKMMLGRASALALPEYMLGTSTQRPA